MPIYRLGEFIPSIDPQAYVSPDAVVIGRVSIARDASIWPGAVLRGDTEMITVGVGSNVQDGAVLHADPGCPMTLGAGVTVGHQAMLHGCTIGDGCLVGIQAVVLNRAVLGARCLVGAAALVTEGKQFAEGSMLIGSPAKFVRPLAAEELAGLQASALNYVDKARLFRVRLQRIDGDMSDSHGGKAA